MLHAGTRRAASDHMERACNEGFPTRRQPPPSAFFSSFPSHRLIFLIFTRRLPYSSSRYTYVRCCATANKDTDKAGAEISNIKKKERDGETLHYYLLVSLQLATKCRYDRLRNVQWSPEERMLIEPISSVMRLRLMFCCFYIYFFPLSLRILPFSHRNAAVMRRRRRDRGVDLPETCNWLTDVSNPPSTCVVMRSPGRQRKPFISTGMATAAKRDVLFGQIRLNRLPIICLYK